MSQPDPIPAGYTALTPYVIVRDGAEAMDFYSRAFGASEVTRMLGPDGRVMHGEINIGGAHLMLTSANPHWNMNGPDHYGGGTAMLVHYCTDADAAFERAVAAGAEAIEPPSEMFWGDRMGKLRDPFGHTWMIATHVRDLTDEEMKAATDKAMAEMTSRAD